MDFSLYVGKWVKVEIPNGNYYLGFVLPETSKEELVIKDKLGYLITLKESYILAIREVSR